MNRRAWIVTLLAFLMPASACGPRGTGLESWRRQDDHHAGTIDVDVGLRRPHQPAQGKETELWAKALVLEREGTQGRARDARSRRHRPRHFDGRLQAAPGEARPGAGGDHPFLFAHARSVVGDNLPPCTSSMPSRNAWSMNTRAFCEPGSSTSSASGGGPEAGDADLEHRHIRLRRQPPHEQGTGGAEADRGRKVEGPGRSRRAGAGGPRRRRQAACVAFGYACHATVMDYFTMVGRLSRLRADRAGKVASWRDRVPGPAAAPTRTRCRVGYGKQQPTASRRCSRRRCSRSADRGPASIARWICRIAGAVAGEARPGHDERQQVRSEPHESTC